MDVAISVGSPSIATPVPVELTIKATSPAVLML